MSVSPAIAARHAEACKAKEAQADRAAANRAALRARAEELAKTMRCNCDLDNWEPERSTGHSRVCRIHRTLMGLQPREFA